MRRRVRAETPANACRGRASGTAPEEALMGTQIGMFKSETLPPGLHVAPNAREALIADGWARELSDYEEPHRLIRAYEPSTRKALMEDAVETSITEKWTDSEKQQFSQELIKKIAKQDNELQFALDSVLGTHDQFTGNSIGLTIVTAGGTISGKAITRDEWKAEHYANFAESPAESIMADEEKFLAQVQADRKQVLRELELPVGPRTYIHFKDATVRAGGTPTSIGYMRVYVSEIIAWSVQELNGYIE